MSPIFPTTTILLADLGDILSALVPVVVFIIWVIGQISNRGKQPQQRPVRPLARPVGEDANAPAADGQKSIFDEIETFLARARQQMQPGDQPTNRPVEAVIVPDKRSVRPARNSMGDPIEVEVSGQLSRRHQVDDHVRRHISTSDMDRHIDQLGDKVEIADDRMEAHLQEKFQHRLGALDTVSQSPAPAPANTPAAAAAAPVDFAALLANSADLKNAIIVNEILQRPAARW